MTDRQLVGKVFDRIIADKGHPETDPSSPIAGTQVWEPMGARMNTSPFLAESWATILPMIYFGDLEFGLRQRQIFEMQFAEELTSEAQTPTSLEKPDIKMVKEWLKSLVPTNLDNRGITYQDISDEHHRQIKDLLNEHESLNNWQPWPWEEGQFYVSWHFGNTGTRIGDWDRAEFEIAVNKDQIVIFKATQFGGHVCPFLPPPRFHFSDRSNLCTIHGADPSEVRTKQKEEGNVGQHSDYLILCDEERAKGFVRPVRNAYIHVGANPEMQGCVLLKKPTDACGSRTQMGKSLAETYARDPSFYGATFCYSCNAHFPVEQFMWEGTTERLGS